MKVDHAVSHLGKSLGISNALRSLARARSPGELGLPRDLQLKHGVSQESLLRGAALTPGLRDAVFDVAACAKKHLDKASF
jgi:NADH dehydrogenase [ubiquinone] 1 alpha subcomplex assembly factor 6